MDYYKLLFDTNAIYYLSNNAFINNEQYNELLNKVKSESLKVYYSPISVIEIITKMYNNPSSQIEIIATAKKFMTLQPKLLQDPETQME